MQTIADINDTFRTTHMPRATRALLGKFVMTHGVASLCAADQAAAWHKVCSFNEFTADNDPHGEHDFGVFTVNGAKFFWKIDYYDKALEHGSDDPSNVDMTTRVLTLMLADEY